MRQGRVFATVLGVTICVMLLGLVRAQEPGDIDFNKARELRRKMLQGEKLSDEERAYLEKARAAFRNKNGGRGEARPPAGLKPLTDMAAGEKYKGEDGGLYGGGRNEPPKAHLEAALRQARRIQPLDARGQPDPDGKIVFISVGMSNTTQVFSQFLKLAEGDQAKSPRVVIVDGAQGGMEAQSWAEPAGGRDPWRVLEQRLRRAGVTREQVQVAWIKQARRNPASLGEFPKHAREMQGHMVVGLQKLRATFPNLQIAYLSSRTYAGYATTQLNPEPYAYESAFVVRWLIRDQIQGDPALNFDPDRGAVQAPLLLWGPYLWADGERGRRTDDLVYRREDFAGDGTHPAAGGRQKVAEQLLHFLHTDPTAKLWYTGR